MQSTKNRSTLYWNNWYKKPNPWGWIGSYNDKMRAKIISNYIKWSNCNKALDIGCGEGSLTYAISNHVNKVDAFDVSWNAIEFAKNIYNKSNINYFQLDISEFKANELKYDLIICSEVIYYLEDNTIKMLFNNIKKSILPSGYFLLLTRVDGTGGQYPTVNIILNLLKEDFRTLAIMSLSSVKFSHRLIKRFCSVLSPILDRWYCARLYAINPVNSFHSLFICIPK